MTDQDVAGLHPDGGRDGGRDGGGRGADVAALRPGDPERLDGYRVLGRLGEGGQGTVFLARDPLGDEVALKVLLPEVLAEPGARDRIAAEVALARRVPSFCTARLLGARLDGDEPYLVTEYVPGRSLAEEVRRDGPMGGSELERLMVGTLTALVTIHRAGVVHHDLKPENILLGPDGPRVVDFGIALRTGARDPQANGDGVLGSAAFLAPERLDAGPATPASDLFGWAATMVHAATGASPFSAPTRTGIIRAVEHSPAVLDGVPAGVRPLLEACLDKDPARRPTASAALTALLEALQPGPVPGSGPPIGGAGTGATSGDPAGGTAGGTGQGTDPALPAGWPTSPEQAAALAAAAVGAPPWGTPGAPAATSRPARPRPPARPGAVTRTWRDPGQARLLPPPDLRRQRSGGGSALGFVVFVGCAIALLVALSARDPGAPVDDPEEGWRSPFVVSESPSAAAPSTPGTNPADWGDTVADGAQGIVMVDATRRAVVQYRRELAGISAPDPDVVTPLPVAAGGVHVEELSTDGEHVVAVSASRTAGRASVEEFRTAGGRREAGPWTLPLPDAGPGRMEAAVARDGSVVAALSGAAPVQNGTSGYVRVWSRRATGQALVELQVPDLRGGLALSADGAWLGFRAGSGTGRYRVQRVSDGRGADLPPDCLGRIAFDRSGSRVFCQTAGALRVLGTDGRVRATLPGTAVPGHLAVSPDGSRAAQVDARDGHVRVVEVATGRRLLDAASSNDAVPIAMAFGRNDQVVTLPGYRFDVLHVPAAGAPGTATPGV